MILITPCNFLYTGMRKDFHQLGLLGEVLWLQQKTDAYSLIASMSEVDFLQLKLYLNSRHWKSAKRIAAEKKFVSEVRAAEESVKHGNYATLQDFIYDLFGVEMRSRESNDYRGE